MTADDDRAELLSNAAYGDDDVDDARSWATAIKLGLALIMFASFVGLVWYAYNLGLRNGSESVAPIIQASDEPIKVEPADPGGLDVPNQDVAVYEAIEGEDGIERYLPPPLAGDDAPADVEEPAAAAEPEPAEAAPPEPATKPEADEPAQIASVPPAEETPGVEPERQPTTAELIGPFRIQLAAFRSPEEATRTWVKLQQSNKDLLGELDLVIEKVDLGAEKGVFYRLQAAPLKSRDAAEGLCGKLQSRQVSCIVIKA